MVKKLTLFFLVVLSNTTLLATDYYVNPTTGNDGNPGTSPATALRSLGKIDNLNLLPGDVVYFMNGTYTRPGQTLLTISESGTPDNPITFRNYEGHQPVLSFDGWTGIDLINGASYITIEGLKIKGARTKITLEQALEQPAGCASGKSGNASGLYNGTGILAVGPNLKWSNGATTGDEVPSHIIIENCEIFDCTSSGIAFQQADYVTVKNNKIYNNCWYTIYGTSGVNLYQFINTDGTTGYHNEISNNLMYGNQLLVPQVPFCSFYDGNALIVDDFRHIQTGNYKDATASYSAYNAKTLIKNNIAVQNGGSGLHFYLSGNCHVYNNSVADNAFQNDGVNGNAELRMGGCYNFKVKNNVFKGTKIHNIGGNWSFDYSHNYQAGPEIDSLFIDNQCEGCIDGELNFVNEDPNDATPYLTDFEGILKNSGTAIVEVTKDYLGNTRSDSALVSDIGAYELQSCYATTWYADADNDGTGTAEDRIASCTQPEGYVSTYGDACPNDSNKIAPGACGCAVAEGTCDTTCTAPTYDVQTAYSNKGTLVLYDGIAYENQWYTKGDIPSAGGPWTAIAVCEASLDCSSVPEWQNQKVYSQVGTAVQFDNALYENKWHTQGDAPDQSSAWELIGGCTSASQKWLLSATPPATAEQHFSIYPKLVLDVIHATTPETANAVLYTLSGQVIASWTLPKGKNTLNISAKKAGVYLLQMTGTTMKSTTKLVKK